LAEAMVFGDHWNDIEMIKGVGIGVSMGNGKEETKQAADFVTASNNEDGIAKALRHFQLI
jgi:hydroxymethylpyrimidine pyrophosphatase-like HAD family hydrolase